MAGIGYVNNPQIKAQVAAHIAAGGTQSDLSDQTGISRPTICKIANLAETKALIDTVHQSLINTKLQQASLNISEVITKYPVYESVKDKDFAGLSLKYSAELLRSVGILPSTGQSILVQNIYNSVTFEMPEPILRVLQQVTHNDQDFGNMLADSGIDAQDNGPNPCIEGQIVGDSTQDSRDEHGHSIPLSLPDSDNGG